MIKSFTLFLQSPFILLGVIYAFMYDGFMVGSAMTFDALGYEEISEDDDGTEG